MPSPTTVALFVTCMVDIFRPQVGEATLAILEGQGLQVVYPEGQTCCGAAGYHAGRLDDAAKLARRWIELFEPYEAIVAPSATCVAMVQQEYPRLLADQNDWRRRAEAVAARTYELSQFLVDVLGVSDLGVTFQGNLTYHPACHLLRLLGVDRQPRALLEAVEGATVVPLADAETCCGFGGIFALSLLQLSSAMAKRKAVAVEGSEADLVVTCETGCLLQMAGTLGRRGSSCRAVHLAELLASMVAKP